MHEAFGKNSRVDRPWSFEIVETDFFHCPPTDSPSRMEGARSGEVVEMVFETRRKTIYPASLRPRADEAVQFPVFPRGASPFYFHRI